ncbi:MAG: hypothetical protein U0903_10370 [Planctomycetales bacterium]
MRIPRFPGIGLGLLLLALWAQALYGEQSADTHPKTDPPPTLKASDLLPRDSLKGINYEITEFVPVQERKCLFTVKAENLEFKVLGKNLLEWRLRELRAWQRARAWDPGRNGDRAALPPVTPIQPVKHSQLTLKSYVSNPRGRLIQPTRTVEESNPLPILPPDARAGSQLQRKLAFDLGCDPETFHPQLHTLLETLAREPQSIPAEELGLVAPRLPTPGWLNLPADQRTLLINKAPHEILQSLDEELTALQIPAETRQHFCHQLDLTTFQKLLLVSHFRGIQNVSGAREIFTRTASAKDEVEALDRIQELGLVQESHRREPLKTIVWEKTGAELETQAGTHILVLAGDYLTADEEFTKQVTQLRARHPQGTAGVYTAASISPAARKLLDRLKIQIQDR